MITRQQWLNVSTAFLVFLFISFVGCGASQRITPNTLPALDPDASVPWVDRDAYVVSISDTVPRLRVMDPDARVTPLSTGQPAPYPGVLFNAPALAVVEVEIQSSQTQCLVERRADQQRVIARAMSDIGHLEASYLALLQQSRVLISGRDEEISRLSRLIRSPSLFSLESLLWFGGGLILGVGIVSTTYMITR